MRLRGQPRSAIDSLLFLQTPSARETQRSSAAR
jgi:hypothetical protein